MISEIIIIDKNTKESSYFNKSIEELRNLNLSDETIASEISNLIGFKLYESGEYEDSMNSIMGALIQNPLNFYALYNTASLLNFIFTKSEVAKRLNYINKALELQPDDFRMYNLRGLIYFKFNNTNEDRKALADFLKAIEIKEDFYDAINNLGNAYIRLDEKENAIKCFERAITFENKSTTNSYLELAKLLDQQGEFLNALHYFNKAIESESKVKAIVNDEKKSNLYNWRGACYAKLGLSKDAFEDFRIAYSFDSNNTDSRMNLGLMSINLRRYYEAIEYLKIIENSDNPKFISNYIHLGLSYLMINNIDKSKELFNKTRESGFNDIKYVEFLWNQMFDRESDNKLLLFLCVDNVNFDTYKVIEERSTILLDIQFQNNVDNFFNQILKEYSIVEINSEDYIECKEIYLKSLEIINLLKVDNEFENTVSHYTKRSSAENLLLLNSPFRIKEVNEANDVEEGKVLNYFLGITKYSKVEQNTEKINDDYNAHIGCFTFNHNSLNQFRLYGTDCKEEVNGICLVMYSTLFSDSTKVNNILNYKEVNSEEHTIDEKLTLYRCIYIDPYTNKIISLGHREEFTFYRSEKLDTDQKKVDAIKKYQEYINNKKEIVNLKLNELNKLVNHSNLEKGLISRLLVQLRYLVKHSAFKEEQECRIIYLNYGSKFTDNYLNYLRLDKYMKSVYYGPHFKNIKGFDLELLEKNMEYDCKQSNHPIKNTI